MKLLTVFLLICVVNSFGLLKFFKHLSEKRRERKIEKEKIKEEAKKEEERKNKFNCEYKIRQGSVETYQEDFRAMDYDNNQEVTPEEFRQQFNSLKGLKPITQEEAEKAVKRLDKNGDGKLDKREWIEFFVNDGLKKLRADNKKTFGLIDTNGDLEISESELVKVFEALEYENPTAMAQRTIEAYECDENKRLNFDEFIGSLAIMPKGVVGFGEPELYEDSESDPLL